MINTDCALAPPRRRSRRASESGGVIDTEPGRGPGPEGNGGGCSHALHMRPPATHFKFDGLLTVTGFNIEQTSLTGRLA